MEGFGLIKSFREIIHNQLLFEAFGIMKSSADRYKKWLILDPKFGYICLIVAKKSNAQNSLQAQSHSAFSIREIILLSTLTTQTRLKSFH